MPRPRTERNETPRAATENWRAKRKAEGRPESSIVDRAVAASVAAFLTESMNAPPSSPQPTIRDVVKGAQRILLKRGYDKHAATAELLHRLSRRPDILELIDVSGAGVESVQN